LALLIGACINKSRGGQIFMSERIVIIQGNPDPQGNHFGHALALAYISGANQSDREVRVIDVAKLEFPLLRSQEDWKNGDIPESIRSSQASIDWADHLVIIYPLWLGTMPALLKAFLEQVFRPGFAMDESKSGMWKKRLTGKSARILVTMGMPAFVYRWFFGAHSLKSLERNILNFVGIKPVRESLIGMVEAANPANRDKWLVKIQKLGQQGK
jgi:putative NADPH-quinone reductase